MKAILKKIKENYTDVQQPVRLQVNFCKVAFIHVGVHYCVAGENYAIGVFSNDLKNFTRYFQNMRTLEIYKF